MNQWDMMIDGTTFGLIAGYLRHPRTRINYLIHVKDRAMLAAVASQIELDCQTGRAAGEGLSPGMQALVRDGSIKVSARHAVENLDRSALVDPSGVRRSAYCQVIYLPPFYLVHTPGLFEGKVMNNRPPVRAEARSQSLSPRNRQCSAIMSAATATAIRQGANPTPARVRNETSFYPS